MPDPKHPQASIAVFRVSGGGAEKVATGLARLLQERKLLSRFYTGSAKDTERFGSMQVCILNSVRAAGAIRPFRRFVRSDPASSFLLTANYAALAPSLRLARPRVRIVVRLAGILSREMQSLSGLPKVRYFVTMGLTFAFADVIIAQGKEMQADAAQLFSWARKKISIINNPIEEEIWKHDVARPLVSEPYIFCAATFRPVKGFDTLLAAFAASPSRKKRKLVVAGIDPDDGAFSSLIDSNGLSQSEVIRLGFVDRPYDLIANADLCVLASRYEGFSNFLLEAAAFGKRIVSTDCPGGNRELFELYPNAILVGVDDIDGLAQAMAADRYDIPREKARSLLGRFDSAIVFGAYLRALFP